jgi:multidrug efflux pump subunit AcrB
MNGVSPKNKNTPMTVSKERFTRYAVKFTIGAIVLAIVAILVFWGYLVNVADGHEPYYSICTSWHGADAYEVEDKITSVIEREIKRRLEHETNTLKKTDRVEFYSYDGYSIVYFKYNWSVKCRVASREVRAIFERVKPALPNDSTPY